MRDLPQLHPSKPVSADDRGLTLGVGLFETLLFVDARPVLWEAHLDRLARGCGVLGLPAPDPAVCTRAAMRALEANQLSSGRAAVRLTWTGGSGARGLAAPTHADPQLFVSAQPAPTPPQSLRLATSSVRRNPSSPTSRLKTLSYLDNVLARGEAVAKGSDEALMLDTEGRLACAAAANLFWLEGERLCTPSLDCGVLDGVVRAQVLRLAPALGWTIVELREPPQRLLESDGAFATSSLIGAAPVTELDGVELHHHGVALRDSLRRLAAVALAPRE